MIGGIDYVTLGDDEVKRRGTQKTILERAQEPTFDIFIELKSRYEFHCYKDASWAVDRLLLDKDFSPVIRVITADGEVEYINELFDEEDDIPIVNIFTFAVNRARLEIAISANSLPCRIVNTPEEANMILTTRNYFKKNHKIEQIGKSHDIPVFAIKTGTDIQIDKFLKHYFKLDDSINATDQLRDVTKLVLAAIKKVEKENKPLELPSSSSFIRRFEHELIAEYGYRSVSLGEAPNRRVKISEKKE